MNDVNYTLFKSLVNNQPTDYQLQVVTEFSTASYANDGFEILHLPEQNQDLLHIKLKVKPGSDNHIVHDFSIGDFPNPNSLSTWQLKIEVYDQNGTKVKDKGQTAQAEIEARPRPAFAPTFNS